TGVINFSEEVGKTFLWKSIAKTKNKSATTDKQIFLSEDTLSNFEMMDISSSGEIEINFS
ncbi:unnamed protein product, partial [Adineta steineri]